MIAGPPRLRRIAASIRAPTMIWNRQNNLYLQSAKRHKCDRADFGENPEKPLRKTRQHRPVTAKVRRSCPSHPPRRTRPRASSGSGRISGSRIIPAWRSRAGTDRCFRSTSGRRRKKAIGRRARPRAGGCTTRSRASPWTSKRAAPGLSSAEVRSPKRCTHSCEKAAPGGSSTDTATSRPRGGRRRRSPRPSRSTRSLRARTPSCTNRGTSRRRLDSRSRSSPRSGRPVRPVPTHRLPCRRRARSRRHPAGPDR